MSKSSNACHVYIIGHVNPPHISGPVKIGIARDPSLRVLELQIGNPTELQLVRWFPMPSRAVARAVERAFHEVQSSKRLKGEWFDMGILETVHLMCINIRSALEATLPETILEEALSMTGVLEAEESVARIAANIIAAEPNHGTIQ